VVNINDDIHPEVLDHFLKLEFSHRHLDVAYEYAIYDCATDRMVYAGTSQDSDGKALSEPEQRFPQLQEFTYYFGINFPDLPAAAARDLRMWFFTAALLVLAMAFFGYALFVIFRQRRLSEVQRDFVNAMTHEFKTPISTLKVASEVLQQPGATDNPERLQQYGLVIAEQVRQLQAHVEHVLQAARVDRRRITLHPEALDLHDVIRSLSLHYEQACLKRGGTFFSDLTADPSVVVADHQHLSGLLHNILDNAVKFAGTPPLIRISTRLIRTNIQLAVGDNGPGIPPKEQHRVFRKFYRVAEGRVPSHRGFGIGLFYVSRVVKAHGWDIRIGKAPEGGADFILSIPLSSHA